MRQVTAMREFKSHDWWMFADDKWIVVVELDRAEERNGLLERLNADGVKIDGFEHKILGVESFCIPTLRAGMTIGLLIARESFNGRGSNDG